MEKFIELEINENRDTVTKVNENTYRIFIEELEEKYSEVALYKMSLPYLFKNVTTENNSFYMSIRMRDRKSGYVLRIDPGFYTYEDLGISIVQKLKEAVKKTDPTFVIPDDILKIKLGDLDVKVDITVKNTAASFGLNPIIARMLGLTKKPVGNFVVYYTKEANLYTTFHGDNIPDITDKTALIITSINWVRKQYSNYEYLTHQVLSVESLANYTLGGMIRIDNTSGLVWLRMFPGVKKYVEVSFSTGEKFLELEPELTVNLTLIVR